MNPPRLPIVGTFGIPPTPITDLYMQLEDTDLDLYHYSIRSCAPCPAVIPLLSRTVPLDKHWQYFLLAINYNMEPNKVAAQLGHARAFANGTGFGKPDSCRANFIAGVNEDCELPAFDKVRTCIRAVFTGKKSFSLLEAFKMVLSSTRDNLRKTMTGILDENILILDMLDGNSPPPMKTGKQLPQSLGDIRPEDYAYNPRENPTKFFSANIINAAGEVVQWSGGALYPWTGDGIPRFFLPHVSRYPVPWPLHRLKRVDTIPSPFRYNP